MRIIFAFFTLFLECQARKVVFDFSNDNGTKTQKVSTNLDETLIRIELVNTPLNADFYIVQAHSFIHNITLSSTPDFKPKTFVRGTNVGLVVLSASESYLKIPPNTTVQLYALQYDAQDPIPGGCNLSLQTQIAPYQIISNSDHMIVVESQPPSASATSCDANNITVEMYHMYLPECNYDPSLYFEGIANMLTVNNIRKNGYKVPTFKGFVKYKNLYSAYKGVGQVFAIVATYNGRSSAYVPAVSYGCDLQSTEDTCDESMVTFWKILCALFFMSGLFITFFGYKFPYSTEFFCGAAAGTFIIYVILSTTNFSESLEAKTAYSALGGFVLGIVWIFLGKALSPKFLWTGFLIASIVLNAGLADTSGFQNNSIFWTVFIIVTAVFWVSLHNDLGHIFGCILVGSYAFIAVMSIYFGGNFQYILINTFRRMVVKNFNMATIALPLQLRDWICHMFFLFLALFGLYYQKRKQNMFPLGSELEPLIPYLNRLRR